MKRKSQDKPQMMTPAILSDRSVLEAEIVKESISKLPPAEAIELLLKHTPCPGLNSGSIINILNLCQDAGLDDVVCRLQYDFATLMEKTREVILLRQRADSLLEAYNQQIISFNAMNKRIWEEYKSRVDAIYERFRPLIETEKTEYYRLHRIAAEARARTSNPTKLPNTTEDVALMQKYVRTEEMTPEQKSAEFFVKIGVGVMMGISLGMVAGVINPYQMISPATLAAVAVGCVISIGAGMAITLLSRKAAIEDLEIAETQEAAANMVGKGRRGNKLRLTKPVRVWRISHLAACSVLAAADVSVAMIGLFGKVMEANPFGGVNSIPPIVIFLACLVLIFPFLLLESMLGQREGEVAFALSRAGKAQAEAMAVIAKSEAGATQKKLEVEAACQEAICNAQLKKAEAIEAERDHEIARIPKPKVYPPDSLLNGGVNSDDEVSPMSVPFKGRIELNGMIIPPPDPELRDALAGQKKVMEQLGETVKSAETELRNIRLAKIKPLAAPIIVPWHKKLYKGFLDYFFPTKS